MNQTLIIVLDALVIAAILCAVIIRTVRRHAGGPKRQPQPGQFIAPQSVPEVEPIDLSGVEVNPEAPEIYNLIILDSSGSMWPLCTAARHGYNQTLNTIREAQKAYPDEQQHFASLVTFNSEVFTLFENEPIREVTNLTEEDYRPQNNTAMFDAIGTALSALKQRLDAKERTMAVVTIISDGEENASREYNLKKAVALIEQMKEMGCTVNFMGPSFKVNDRESYAEHMAKQLHIDNFLAFEYTEEGFDDAWNRQSRSSHTLYHRMNEYEAATRHMSKEERARYYRERNRDEKFYDN